MIDKNTIPEHWNSVRLGDFVKTEKGKKPKLVSDRRTEKCSVPYINIKAFEKNIIDEYTDGAGCVICEDDDFLMVWDGSRSGYVGKAKKGALGSTLVKIKLPEIDHNFAYYFLQSKFIEINTKTKGVGIPHVDPNLVWNYILPLPTLNEQSQIVSKIEELFSELDIGRQQLETVKQQLKIYRQAVLKWAFEGRFTGSPGREMSVNDHNQTSLPNGWKITSFGEVCHKIGDIDHKMPKSVPDGYPYISTKDFTEDLRISFKNVKTIGKEDYEALSRKIKPENGDIIFPRYGTIGNNILIDFNKEFLVSYSCAVIKPNNNLVLSKYLYYYSLSPHITDEIKKYVVETTQANIGIASIKKFKLFLSPLKQQECIINEIESRLSVCNKIEEIIETSLKLSESLRQSILKHAFEGKLGITNL
jgi:type I restriction enzyme S subunit